MTVSSSCGKRKLMQRSSRASFLSVGIISSPFSMAHLGAHLAFRSRWQKTDNELCRHSMSFILHKAIRDDFFQSYLYLLEKVPLGK